MGRNYCGGHHRNVLGCEVELGQRSPEVKFVYESCLTLNDWKYMEAQRWSAPSFA